MGLTGNMWSMIHRAFMLSPDYERVIAASSYQGATQTMTLDHGVSRMLLTHLRDAMRELNDPTFRPMVVVPPQIAEVLRASLAADAPKLEVVSYAEINEGDQVDEVDTINLPFPIHIERVTPTTPAVHVDREDMGEASDWNWG